MTCFCGKQIDKTQRKKKTDKHDQHEGAGVVLSLQRVDPQPSLGMHR